MKLINQVREKILKEMEELGRKLALRHQPSETRSKWNLTDKDADAHDRAVKADYERLCEEFNQSYKPERLPK